MISVFSCSLILYPRQMTDVMTEAYSEVGGGAKGHQIFLFLKILDIYHRGLGWRFASRANFFPSIRAVSVSKADLWKAERFL